MVREVDAVRQADEGGVRREAVADQGLELPEVRSFSL